jgi:hypothetical protein
MRTPVMRYLFVPLGVALLLHIGVPLPQYGEAATIRGTMAGKIYEKSSRTVLSDVRVKAHSITTNQLFTSDATDARGSYMIPDVPAGIYAFSIEYQGTDYTVSDRLDARAGMSFLLETCFQLDPSTKTASVLPECKSELYSDTQVVSIGPHRFFRTNDIPQEETTPGQTELLVTHTALECFATDQFSILTATIEPGELVQSSRVYFRAEQYADFYYVEMEGTGDEFSVILPKPSPETERVVYYIEAVDVDFNAAQTPEAAPEVDDADSCKRRYPEAAYFAGDNPDIVVGAVKTGTPAVPLGFQASGITGFISATGVVSGLGAATAGAAGAAGAAAGATSVMGSVLIVSGATAATTAVATQATRNRESSPPK